MRVIDFKDIRIGDKVRAEGRDVAHEGVVGQVGMGFVAAKSGRIIGISRDRFFLLERPVEQSPTKPTVGRTVLFRARTDGVVSAATILRTVESTVPGVLESWDRRSRSPEGPARPKGIVNRLPNYSTVDLLVHGLAGDYREYAVPYSTKDEHRTWFWPERE